MALTEKQRRYMRDRRARLRDRGTCVDCQQRPAKPGKNRSGKPYTCCETCLQARRDRYHEGSMPPLFRAIPELNLRKVH
jgi:hypothetical protein